jgi:type I restriction enzyme R subunit
VLAYVKFTLAPLARTERAALARKHGFENVDQEMRSFLDGVLTGYEIHGVEELELGKIRDFLKVKYGGTNGGKQALGDIPSIRAAFTNIQSHLYSE